VCLALAPLPQPVAVAPLDNETLETPDLLAGEIPDGVNPTESIQTVTPSKTDAAAAPQPKRIEIPPNNGALPKAPIAGLTRQSRYGPVPAKGSNSALKAYKRPFQREARKTPVSLRRKMGKDWIG